MSGAGKLSKKSELERSVSSDDGRIIRRLGRYHLVRKLGRGGMASVYLAKTVGPGGFHKWLAIKRIHPHLADEKKFVNMFLDEARIAAAIQHPNVAQVFELGEERGEFYIVMEHLHGEHLGSVWARAREKRDHLPYKLAASIIASAARGLHHAHEAKDELGSTLSLIHRDVTPQNIFVTYGGEVKITDFGVAKAVGRLTTTEVGGVKGKWAYMAPEQINDEELDRGIDIFALGTVAWELTTGEHLFKAESDVLTAMRITSGYLRPPSEIVKDFPMSLERVIMRALARHPDDRYQSAGAMADDLDRCIAAELGGVFPAASELSTLMKELFGARMKSWAVELKELAATAPTDGTRNDIDERSGPKTRRSPLLAIPLLVVLVGFAVGVFFMWPTSSPQIEADRSGQQVAVLATPSPAPPEAPPASLTTSKVGNENEAPRPEPRPEKVENEEVVVDHVPSKSVTSKGTKRRPPPRAPARKRTSQPLPERSSTTKSRPIAATSKTHGVNEPARIELSSRPWASVSINGRPAGETPIVKQVPAGQLVIRLQREGTGPVRVLRLRARPGETISRRVVFE